MKTRFAKIVFWAAGIWGVLVLTPLFFIFNVIGRNDPPPITHPGFYYGFATVGLTFQIVFMVIASDPIRFRLMMIPSVIEKFSYAMAVFALYLQQGYARETSRLPRWISCSDCFSWRRSSKPRQASR